MARWLWVQGALRNTLARTTLARTALVRNTLARNTLWMMLSQGMRLVLEAGYFILIARYLGAAEYGAFAGVRALILILAPFAGLGTTGLLVKNAARDRSRLGTYWGNAIVMSLGTGAVLTLLVVALARVILPATIPLLLVLLVALADFICRRIFDAASAAFMAVEQLHRSAQLDVGLGVARLLAAVALAALIPRPGAVAWAALYLATLALGALWGAWLVWRRLARPTPALHLIPGELSEGFYFAVSTASQTAYTDLDKAMLARLATLPAVGIYAAAYRIIDVAYVPVRALFLAAYARIFRHGAAGLAGSVRFARRLLPVAALYGLGAGIALLLAAPLVPLVLGAEYVAAVAAIRWLAPLPLLKAARGIAADALTGAGHQGWRSAVQFGAALGNFGLNLWLIPRYSWRGAAWASLATDGALVLALWSVVALLHPPAASSPPNDGAGQGEQPGGSAGVTAGMTAGMTGRGDQPG